MTNRPAIFVSATSSEFRSFRLAVKQQLERKGVLMIVQDDFPTDYGEVRRMLASRIQESDAVICLVGFAYGAEPRGRSADAPRRSYTQIEYDLAQELRKPVYVFLSDELDRPCDNSPNEDSEAKQLQINHRATLSSGDQLWHSFADKAQLQALIDKIRLPATDPPQLSSGRLTQSAERLFGREAELEYLDAAWVNPDIRVLSLVAWGGVGKTSLMNYWMAQLAHDDWRFAERVFDWSFFSQGAREAEAASADTFIAAALEFFGDAALARSDQPAWEKGARLGQLIAEKRTLLVLDGLESLQHPPGPMAGQLKDAGLVALLRRLAQRSEGLCIITTREGVTDLDPFRETTSPEWRLQRLSRTAGISMLKAFGLHGAESEFQETVEEVAGHALTLNLLGRYLAKAHQGDIRRRDRVSFDKADALVQGGHAFRTISAYERWFAESGQEGARALAMLRLSGYFDRPADDGCLSALLKKPAIEGLTESLVDLDEADKNLAISSLQECGLWSIGGAGPATLPLIDARTLIDARKLDAHPLIREYFAKQLREKYPNAWHEGHRRLCEYLSNTTADLPDGIDGLQPLYQAIAHGCKAGLHQEMCDDIYLRRILRGAQHYSWQIGAYGDELAALACFFEKPWQQPVAKLNENCRNWLLNEAAIVLGAVNHVAEALEPMRLLLNEDIRLGSWNNAITSSGNLSELEVTYGDTQSATKSAEQAVSLADRSGTDIQQMVSRAILADALHQAGSADAISYFRDSEMRQAQIQPMYPILYSGRGFRYCELILGAAERAAWRRMQDLEVTPHIEDLANACIEANQRAARTLKWDRMFDRPIDLGFHRLTMARTGLYALLLGDDPLVDQSGDEEEIKLTLRVIEEFTSEAISQFHIGRDMGQMPRGYLTRAWVRAVRKSPEGSQADLDEGLAIAQGGPMRLHLADVYLHRARLFGTSQPYPWNKNSDGTARGPKDDLAAARKLIEQCGYWRRKEELEDAEAAAKNWD